MPFERLHMHAYILDLTNPSLVAVLVLDERIRGISLEVRAHSTRSIRGSKLSDIRCGIYYTGGIYKS